MIRTHPAYGELVVSNSLVEGGKWMIRNSPVALDEVLDMIEEGFGTQEILMRHLLVLRADLVEITLLHALAGPREASA
jgi:uncharacterized protein (DUF433 family)